MVTARCNRRMAMCVSTNGKVSIVMEMGMKFARESFPRRIISRFRFVLWAPRTPDVWEKTA